MLAREDGVVVAGTVAVGAAAIGVAASTNETGPILAFVAALMVVLITAYTTNRRQDRALAAEQERQDRALAAEQARLNRELEEERQRLDHHLRHERFQIDLADLRTILGDGLAATDRARQAAIDGWLISDVVRQAAIPVLQEMETYMDRLRIRLGKDDPLVVAYTTMGNAVHVIQRMEHPAERPDSATLIGLPEMLAFGAAYHEYVAEAQARVGFRDVSSDG
jgi:hypothetical protein